MKRMILSGLLSLTLVPAMVRGAAGTFENPSFGIVDTPIVIDAVNFINYGTFNIITPTLLPFETFNTLNYTNYGTMISIPGWRFTLNPSDSGVRRMAANFVNFNPGTIAGVDAGNGGTGLTAPCVVSPLFPSYLYILATNIVTGAGGPTLGASLIVGANGEMRIDGQNVNLSYSGLEVLPIWAEPIGTVTDNTNFLPDIGIFDLYWAQAQFAINNPLRSGTLWVGGTTANAQGVPSPPTQPQGTPAPAFSIFLPIADSYINSDFQIVTLTNFTGSPTNVIDIVLNNIIVLSNITKGAAFVGVPAGMDAQIGFTPSQQFNNNAQTIGVSLSANILNRATGNVEPALIHFIDTLASDTAVRGNAINLVGCSDITSRPANYQMDRGLLPIGGPGNAGYPEPNFFLDSGNIIFDPINVIFDSVTNATLTAGEYSAYGALLDNVVNRLPLLPIATFTNLPGKIRIRAKNLDLTETRIRGEGSILIEAENIISTSNAVIDVENISLNVNSTNATFKLQNLVGDLADRMRGDILAWSATWSNQVRVIFTNNYGFTNVIVGTNMVGTNLVPITNIFAFPEPITNMYTVRYHTLMLDASLVTTVLPVTVYDLATHTLDVVVNDNVTVVQSLLFDGLSLTINGNFSIPGVYPPDPLSGLLPSTPAIRNWDRSTAPNLLHFTNNGTLTVANQARFGDDRPLYANFINAGTISAAAITVNSFYFENRGSLISSGPIIMQGNIGKLEDGSSTASTITRLIANDLKFSNYQLSAGNGALFLVVSNSLSDAGPGSGNLFQVRDGFNLLVKPLAGDLLGTTIQDTAPPTPSVRIDHVWAAEDRGPSPSGFTDNAAIGTLVLSSLSPRPLFVFRGTGAHNGLYVDLLDLTGLSTNLLNEIQINPNLVIYFAAANLPAGFPLPANTSPEEFLDGQFNGHLRWVSGFAGPNSSQFAVVNGNSILVNQALFNSMLLDSDNDGSVNGIDVDPGGVFQGDTAIVEVNGNGTVTPDLNGQTLIIGQPYSITAVPADGWVFSGWTGSTDSLSKTLVFVMESGLDFVANFSFVPKAGTYNGLFYEIDGVQFGASGYLTLTTTKAGKYTGVIQMGSTKASFSGQLDGSGNLFKVIPRKNNSPVTLELAVGGRHATGTITDGNFTANVSADLAELNGVTRIAPFAGRYTMIFPGSGNPDDDTLPLGSGFGAVTVNTSGKVSFSGVLADGTKVTQASTVSADGNWPLYVPFSGNKGQLLGWITFLNNGVQDFGGSVNWIKRPNGQSALYPAGFNFSTNATGSIYSSTKKPVTDFDSGTVRLKGGNLSSDIIGFVSVASNNKVTSTGGTKVTVTLNPPDGIFKGSVVNPANGKVIKFNGMILQRSKNGAGFFINGGESGEVTFRP